MRKEEKPPPPPVWKFSIYGCNVRHCVACSFPVHIGQIRAQDAHRANRIADLVVFGSYFIRIFLTQFTAQNHSNPTTRYVVYPLGETLKVKWHYTFHFAQRSITRTLRQYEYYLIYAFILYTYHFSMAPSLLFVFFFPLIFFFFFARCALAAPAACHVCPQIHTVTLEIAINACVDEIGEKILCMKNESSYKTDV